MRCSKTIAYQVRSTLIGRDQWILRRRAARIDTLPYRRQRARPDNWTLFTQSTSRPATHDTCQCQHKERTCLFLEKETKLVEMRALPNGRAVTCCTILSLSSAAH